VGKRGVLVVGESRFNFERTLGGRLKGQIAHCRIENDGVVTHIQIKPKGRKKIYVPALILVTEPNDYSLYKRRRYITSSIDMTHEKLLAIYEERGKKDFTVIRQVPKGGCLKLAHNDFMFRDWGGAQAVMTVCENGIVRCVVLEKKGRRWQQYEPPLQLLVDREGDVIASGFRFYKSTIHKLTRRYGRLKCIDCTEVVDSSYEERIYHVLSQVLPDEVDNLSERRLRNMLQLTAREMVMVARRTGIDLIRSKEEFLTVRKFAEEFRQESSPTREQIRGNEHIRSLSARGIKVLAGEWCRYADALVENGEGVYQIDREIFKVSSMARVLPSLEDINPELYKQLSWLRANAFVTMLRSGASAVTTSSPDFLGRPRTHRLLSRVDPHEARRLGEKIEEVKTGIRALQEEMGREVVNLSASEMQANAENLQRQLDELRERVSNIYADEAGIYRFLNRLQGILQGTRERIDLAEYRHVNITEESGEE